MSLTNKKILFVVAPTNFKDVEYFTPREILQKAGATVYTASLNGGLATSEQGKSVELDYVVDEIKAREFEAVVFIGGPGMVELVDETMFIDLALDFFRVGKIVSAICIAPVILAKAGILTGKRATVHPSGSVDLEERGALCTDEAVTVDGRLITAQGPSAAQAFGQKIVQALS